MCILLAEFTIFHWLHFDNNHSWVSELIHKLMNLTEFYHLVLFSNHFCWTDILFTPHLQSQKQELVVFIIIFEIHSFNIVTFCVYPLEGALLPHFYLQVLTRQKLADVMERLTIRSDKVLLIHEFTYFHSICHEVFFLLIIYANLSKWLIIHFI